MAARVNKIRHDENTREKIRVAKYLNILDEIADGTRQATTPQLKAIELLLSKSLPSLQSVEISGDIKTTYVARMPQKQTSMEQWQANYIAPTTQTTQ